MSNYKRDLADFVRSNSMLFLILDCSNSFLIKQSEQWTTDEDYLSTKEIVNQVINVINDAAEWGFKLASDYVSSSRNEATFQESLQIIEEHTIHVSNLRRIYRSKKMCLKMIAWKL